MMRMNKDVAQRKIEIATLRGMPPEILYTFDLLPYSPIFDDDVTIKTEKSQLVAELESHLSETDYHFNGSDSSETHVYLNFMSKIR